MCVCVCVCLFVLSCSRAREAARKVHETSGLAEVLKATCRGGTEGLQACCTHCGLNPFMWCDLLRLGSRFLQDRTPALGAKRWWRVSSSGRLSSKQGEGTRSPIAPPFLCNHILLIGHFFSFTFFSLSLSLSDFSNCCVQVPRCQRLVLC